MSVAINLLNTTITMIPEDSVIRNAREHVLLVVQHACVELIDDLWQHKRVEDDRFVLTGRDKIGTHNALHINSQHIQFKYSFVNEYIRYYISSSSSVTGFLHQGKCSRPPGTLMSDWIESTQIHFCEWDAIFRWNAENKNKASIFSTFFHTWRPMSVSAKNQIVRERAMNDSN